MAEDAVAGRDHEGRILGFPAAAVRAGGRAAVVVVVVAAAVTAVAVALFRTGWVFGLVILVVVVALGS